MLKIDTTQPFTSTNAMSTKTLRSCISKAGFNAQLDISGTHESTILNAELDFEQGRVIQGIQVHRFNGTALCDVNSTTLLTPGVTFGVLIEGTVNFSLNNTQHTVIAGRGPTLFCYNLLHNAHFSLRLTPNTYVNKLIVTLPHTLLGQESRHIKTAQEFLTTHTAFYQCAANSELFSVALQLNALNKPEATAATTSDIAAANSIKPQSGASHTASHKPDLLYDAKALELAALALSHIQLKPYKKNHSQHSTPYGGSDANPHNNTQGLRVAPEQIRNYIDTHLVRPEPNISVQTLAQQLNMSLSKLQRIFKKEFGKTVYDYAREQRLTKARIALTDKKISIGEAAYLAGYKHVSNFSLAYKKEFGVTPGGVTNNG